MVLDPNHSEFPAEPTEPNEPFDAVAYWESACYLMMALLGWTNPAKGLLWWYNHKQDTYDDIRLALLKDIWNQNNELDLLAAWFWSVGHKWTDYFHLMARHADRGLCRPVQVSPDSAWWEDFHRKFPADESHKQSPYSCYGSNPLHLLMFSEQWEDPVYNCKPEKISAKIPRAILTLPNAKGWYPSLSSSCKELGLLGYDIDVLSKDIGWLGSFRLSPVTGLWYQGRHHIHLEGNLHPKKDGIQSWENSDFFSKYDQRTMGSEARSFMEKMGHRIADFDDSIDFQFPLAGKYYSKNGKPRTILGYGFNAESEPVYIIRIDNKGAMDLKRTYKAHQEYSNQIGFDLEVWQNLLKGN
jgi:hypothetical protein